MILPLRLERAGLLLIDLQRDVVHPDGAFARQGWSEMDEADVATLIHNCQRLIDAMRRADRPVVFIETAFRRDYADCALAPPWVQRLRAVEGGCLVDGSWGAEVMDGLVVEPRDFVVIKKGHGAFQHTHLDRLLSNLRTEHCVLAGGAVTESLNDTARMGAALRYEQFLVEDAVYPLRSPHLNTLKYRVQYVTTESVVSLASAPPVAAPPDGEPACALIIVDMQNDFVHPDGAVSRYGDMPMTDAERRQVIGNVRKLAGAVRARGWPVIFVNVGRRADERDSAQSMVAYRRWPMPSEAHYMEYGSWGTRVVEGLELEASDIVVEKKGHSAFGFTPLHRILRNLGIRRCLVTGGATHGCVSDTVREGVGLGYTMTIISDATYPPEMPYHQLLARRGAVCSAEAVMAELGLAVEAGRPHA